MTTALLPRLAGWRDQAACSGLATRDTDLWAPDDTLSRRERDFRWHLARRVCAECPVRVACVQEALDDLPLHGAETMRGGLTPDELRSLARRLERPYRLSAQHGSRSKYVAGCRCDDCRNAHRAYEHERRLQRPTTQRRRDQTPRQKVAARVTSKPRSAEDIAAASGLPLREVRILLAEGVAAGRVDVTSRHPHGQLVLHYARARSVEVAA